MRLAFDMAGAPNDEELRTLGERGFSAACGYLGGNTPSPWSPDDWARIAKAGWLLLPIWVAHNNSETHEAGAQAGNEALVAMQAAHLTGIVCLDVEAGYNVQAEWVEGFEDALANGACDLALYGIGRAIDGLSGSRLFTWVANPQNSSQFLHDTNGVQWFYGPWYDGSFFDEESAWAELAEP